MSTPAVNGVSQYVWAKAQRRLEWGHRMICKVPKGAIPESLGCSSQGHFQVRILNRESKAAAGQRVHDRGLVLDSMATTYTK